MSHDRACEDYTTHRCVCNATSPVQRGSRKQELPVATSNRNFAWQPATGTCSACRGENPCLARVNEESRDLSISEKPLETCSFPIHRDLLETLSTCTATNEGEKKTECATYVRASIKAMESTILELSGPVPSGNSTQVAIAGCRKVHIRQRTHEHHNNGGRKRVKTVIVAPSAQHSRLNLESQ